MTGVGTESRACPVHFKLSTMPPHSRAFEVAQWVKNMPVTQEVHVQSLGGEEPLEEGMATHSGGLVWEIPRSEEPGGLQSRGSKRVGHD